MNLLQISWRAAVIAAGLCASVSPAAGPAGSQLAPDVAAAYIAPSTRVDIGGGVLNLHCTGDGPRTVVFEAGGSDWSVIWALVQPQLGPRFRACSYDRAGLGYSDPSPWPRTPIAIVEDLHSLVGAAALPRRSRATTPAAPATP